MLQPKDSKQSFKKIFSDPDLKNTIYHQSQLKLQFLLYLIDA